MGFRIYRVGSKDDFLHETYWDESMHEYCDICFYEIMNMNHDEIREKLPEWYELLLPFAGQSKESEDTCTDMLAFMKRTLDANDTWDIL